MIDRLILGAVLETLSRLYSDEGPPFTRFEVEAFWCCRRILAGVTVEELE